MCRADIISILPEELSAYYKGDLKRKMRFLG
jgi:hypothetical protein